MKAALGLILALCACAPSPEMGQVGIARDVKLATGVGIRVQTDLTHETSLNDELGLRVATLLGPTQTGPEMVRTDIVLLMNGRVIRGFEQGEPVIGVDWDVRDLSGTEVALFRVAIVPRDRNLGISDRDLDGLAYYSAESLISQENIREIIRQRR